MADTPQAILSSTKNLRTRESMLLGSGLEGGWSSPYPVGDNGTSFGPYQMHEGGALTALGLTPAQAENALTATKAMLPAYQNAVNQISDAKWKNDPESAAEQTAVIAEKPSQDYFASRGAATVGTVWQNTQGVLSGKKSSAGMPPTDANLTSAGDALGGIGGLFSAISGLLAGNPLSALGSLSGVGTAIRTDFERVGLVVFGAILVIVGIVILAMPAVRGGVGTAASLSRGGRAIGNLGGSGGDDAAKTADRERRQQIASHSLALGEKKIALAQQRENRLAGKQDFGS